MEIFSNNLFFNLSILNQLKKIENEIKNPKKNIKTLHLMPNIYNFLIIVPEKFIHINILNILFFIIIYFILYFYAKPINFPTCFQFIFKNKENIGTFSNE